MSACEAALTRAKNLDIDECEAIFVQKKIFTVRITDSEIAEIKQNQDKNLGIRVINQKKISSAQTNNPDKYSRIIEQALQSSKFLKPKKY
ncbi:MAG: DNA gyrase modulator, partial [Nitrosopumilaceae archaeon]